ncbi:MAG: prenyltransferase/squalene oxidase repeat-containing protein, partial [Candidatus Thorarchaeota archaeon]
DASCGSGNGTTIDPQVITLLVRLDLPTILVGRAAWLVHRLRQTGPPGTTAPVDTQLQTTPEFTGAVFLSQPQSLSKGSLLTTEAGLNLPVDNIQAERSRLIELTGTTTPAALSPLRYESWPLDVFLFGPEDPVLLTGAGKGLLVNTVAYATSLRENKLANLFQSNQFNKGQTLAGGLHHSHTPSLTGTYHAVHTMHDLLDIGPFATWRLDNQGLVQLILTDLYVDLGSEAGFTDSIFESTVSIDTTAMGLWLTSVMGLGSQFSVTEITAYLSSRQSVEGGWSDDMTVTFHVTEALFQSGGFGAIDTMTLESWLRSCVIDGSTGTPENWGGLGRTPTDGVARNIYASQYVQSLWMLGMAHTDPGKITEWIQDTSNGDGSFSDTIAPDLYLTRGTVSALTTMSILGTLDPSNHTAGLNWLTVNQLSSGGFGLGESTDDIVAKTWSAAEVATCLREMGETSDPITTNIQSFINGIQSDAGFELMEEIPTLMWSYWLSEVNRMAHTGTVDNSLIDDYLVSFEGFGFSMFPKHSNLSVMSAPEYDIQQYYLTGTWAQYFGAGLARSAVTTLSPSIVSDLTLYLSLRQHSSGHYRPSTMGTAHMQYSVAAVEALFQVDELDTIWYRAELEAEVMAQYSSGQWSATGWNLEPFNGVQQAIDFLSTRTALRLGLVTPLMAGEIVSTIESRLQYGDLWALSWDVRTLSLLNSSSFSCGLETFDRTTIISALGSAFTDGWLNSSTRWQPVFTAGVLDMVSILGLRPQMMDVDGCILSTTIPATVQLGSSLDIGVSISSARPTHSVYVHAFDSWTLFENVVSLNTLSLSVPSDGESIGVQEISLVVWNEGMSRAFDDGTTEVLGTMEGTLAVPTPDIIRGDPILGTVSWTLTGGGAAGPTDVNVRLSNATYFEESTTTQQSPYDISVPTDGFSEGSYNLIVTLSRTGCDDLVLWQAVSITQPEDTIISSMTPLTGGVGNKSEIS